MAEEQPDRGFAGQLRGLVPGLVDPRDVDVKISSIGTGLIGSEVVSHLAVSGCFSGRRLVLRGYAVTLPLAG
jgi:hypothetical protein